MIKTSRSIALNESHPLVRGIIGSWFFNEGSGSKVYDISRNNNPGDFNNMDASTDWVGSIYGGGLDFDGSNDYVEIPDNPTQSGMSELTVFVRLFYRDRSVSFSRIINKGESNGPYQLFVYGSTGHDFGYYLNGITGSDVDTNIPLIQNAWNNLCFTYDGASAKLYLNGKLEHTNSGLSGNIDSSTQTIIIGGHSLGDKAVDGLFDSIIVYNRTLNDNEVFQLYTNPYSILKDKNPSPSIFSVGDAITKIVNETVGNTDSSLKFLNIKKLINETTGLSETLLKYFNIRKIASETIGINETLVRLLNIRKIIQESIGSSETFLKYFNIRKIINETEGITGTIIKVLGAIADLILKPNNGDLALHPAGYVLNTDHSILADGTDGRVEIANDTNFATLTEISIAFWFNPDVTINSSANVQGFVVKNTAGAKTGDYWVGTGMKNGGSTDGTIEFHHQANSNNGGTVYTTVTSWAAGTWHHIVATFKNGSATKIYVNGLLDNTGTNGVTIGDNSSPVYLCANHADAGGLHYYDGKMDRVRIWDVELTAAEAKNAYEFKEVQESNLLLRLNFEGNLTDTSGGSNNGTFGGGIDYDSAFPIQILRPIPEVIGGTENTPRVGISKRILNELVNITDSALRFGGIRKINNDVIGLTGSIIKALGSIKIISEINGITDSILRTGGTLKVVNEIIDLADSFIKRLAIFKIIDTAVDISSNIIKNINIKKLIVETINSTEGTIKLFSIYKIINNVIGLTGSIIKKLDISKIVNEIINSIEGALKLSGISVLVNESLGIIESILSSVGNLKIINETININAVILRLGTSKRVVNETENTNETQLRKGVSIRVVTELLNFTEGVLRKLGFTKIVNSVVIITEFIISATGIKKVINEIIGITEAILSFIGINKIITEVINISESLLRLGVSKRIINEISNISEPILRKGVSIRIINETIGLIEAIIDIVTGDLIRIINESVAINDIIVFNNKILKLIAESIGIVESVLNFRFLNFFKAQLKNITPKRMLRWIN